ncbi:MAG: hypothetical protein C0392_05780 [Syntrophus sp. (in: bacteria)]|nr:hypothetical protein [Syntrophus sp. (in: bacteria)]
MTREVKRRIRKIEEAFQPRYPEHRKYTPEERAFFKEAARRSAPPVIKEHITDDEIQSIVDSVIEEMRAEGWAVPNVEKKE